MQDFRLSSFTLAVVAGFAGSGALAQDLCGGIGDAGQWIGGNEAASDIATATAAQEQMALVLGGNEYVALFTLSADSDVRIEAQGRGAGDPQLDVLDATGSVMVSDDDSGGGGSARAETALAAGTYCVAVRSYDGTPMTSFVRVGRSEHEPLTAGLVVEDDTPTNPPAASLSCADAQPMDGSLDDGGLTGTASVTENGYWRFTLDAPTALTLRATNADADPVMTLYDSTDTYLAENDDYDGLNSQIDMTEPLAAGDYCIQITAITDNSLPITTTVSTFDPAEALRGQIDSGEVAPPLDGSVAILELGALERRMLHEVDIGSDVTWFQFEMGSGLLLAEAVAVGEGTDTWMVLYDDLGRQVSMNDDYGDTYDSLIAARVSGGTYLLGVKRLEDGGYGRVRILLEHYVAAP